MSGDNPNWSSGYTGNLGYFTFYNNKMYFPNGSSGIIYEVDLSGNKTVWASGLGYAQGCIAYGDSLYVTNASNGTITKVLLSDPTIFTLAWTTTGGAPQGIAEYGGYLYVSLYGGTISKISITDPTGSSNLNWATLPVSGTTALALSGEYLYVGFDGTSQNVCRVKLSDASFLFNWATLPSGSADGLVINNGYLYASNSNTGDPTNTIYRILLTDPLDITPWKTGITKTTYGIGYYDNYIYAFSGGAQIIGQFYLEPPPPPPPLPCFKKDSKILTDQGYKLVQDLRKGDLVKTLNHGFLPIDMIGKRDIHHDALEERIKDQLYQYSNDTFEEIFEPLIITGCHSILIDEFVSDEERAKTAKVLGDIYLTDDKYRLPACVDEKASVYKVPGDYTIYHIALENEHYTGNYGIYANGLLVETCSKRYLKEHSHMVLIE